jgi:hypothetical protein
MNDMLVVGCRNVCVGPTSMIIRVVYRSSNPPGIRSCVSTGTPRGLAGGCRSYRFLYINGNYIIYPYLKVIFVGICLVDIAFSLCVLVVEIITLVSN